MLRRAVIILLFMGLFLTAAASWHKSFATQIEQSLILISEIKINNDSTGFNEFIEIYNNSSEAIKLSDYRLAYINVYNPTNQTPTYLTLGSGSLAAGEFLIFARNTSQIPGSLSLANITSLRDEQGTIRLLGPDTLDPTVTKIYDQVSWHNSSSPSSGVYKLPANVKSLQKYSKSTNSPVIFQFDMAPFDPNPYSYLYLEPDSDGSGNPSIPQLSCEGIIITEILPNPAGSDTGKEFIELYNPSNEVISLEGCSLQTSANSKTYTFSLLQIEPGKFMTFYDSQTGLTLNNSSGGTVWLLSATDELQAITYPPALADDVSWSLFNSEWQGTYSMTPGGTNVLTTSKPCPVGQVRNPETSRCTNIVTLAATSATPCREGYERNPITNRCRSIISTSRTLSACKPGQERNPETNRCRNITSSNLKPCTAGQERNPETNRCRKIASSGSVKSLANVKDVATATTADKFKWVVAGTVVVAAGGYAIFEWRRDIYHRFLLFKRRFSA